MKRNEFLEQLERLLMQLPYDERREIMADYESHFKEGLSAGQSEEALIENLGTPAKIAARYVSTLPAQEPVFDAASKTLENVDAPALRSPSNLDGTNLQPAASSAQSSSDTSKSTPTPSQGATKKSAVGNSSSERVALSVVLILFNCFFLVWMYIAHWSVVIGLGAAGIGMVVGGFALLLSSAFAVPFIVMPAALAQAPLLLVSGSLILICLGGLLLIVLFYIIRLTCYVTGKYFTWNMHVIRGY